MVLPESMKLMARTTELGRYLTTPCVGKLERFREQSIREFALVQQNKQNKIQKHQIDLETRSNKKIKMLLKNCE